MTLFLKFLTLTFFTCLVTVSLFAQKDISDSSTGETFPSNVSINHDGKDYQLKATGVSTRKKFFVKVYSIAHYLQDSAFGKSADKLKEIMSDNNAKEFLIKWVRSVDAKTAADGYRDSFKGALTSAEYSQLQSVINQYISFFNQDIKEGDEHVIRWLPGGYIEAIINGNKAGNITNPDFARALWSVWFGSKSVVNRDGLVSLM